MGVYSSTSAGSVFHSAAIAWAFATDTASVGRPLGSFTWPRLVSQSSKMLLISSVNKSAGFDPAFAVDTYVARCDGGWIRMFATLNQALRWWAVACRRMLYPLR